jgi:predicted GIY-YIG superfamily endonuclease
VNFDPRSMFYCYVLQSPKTGRRCVGSCENLAERIRRHNAGDSKATKHGVPWVLLHSETFPTRSEAANANDTTRVAVAEMNLISYDRAVAAATGRRFKSSRPDVAARVGKFGYISTQQR